MKSFFEGIPGTLYEAAELDGATPVGIFARIVLPLSKPALASIGLFIAVGVVPAVVLVVVPELFSFPHAHKLAAIAAANAIPMIPFFLIRFNRFDSRVWYL